MNQDYLRRIDTTYSESAHCSKKVHCEKKENNITGILEWIQDSQKGDQGRGAAGAAVERQGGGNRGAAGLEEVVCGEGYSPSHW